MSFLFEKITGLVGLSHCLTQVLSFQGKYALMSGTHVSGQPLIFLQVEKEKTRAPYKRVRVIFFDEPVSSWIDIPQN